MRNFFSNLFRRFRNSMIGRYGLDECSRFLMWAGIFFLFLGIFPPLRILAIPAWILVFYAYFRCFSRNIVKRSKERDRYLRFTGRFKNRFSVLKRRWNDRKTHRYFKCSTCKALVRVPKGKGRIQIRCTKCGNEFIKTT